eukprot:5342494-Prymnesium_polylepis.1
MSYVSSDTSIVTISNSGVMRLKLSSPLSVNINGTFHCDPNYPSNLSRPIYINLAPSSNVDYDFYYSTSDTAHRIVADIVESKTLCVDIWQQTSLIVDMFQVLVEVTSTPSTLISFDSETSNTNSWFTPDSTLSSTLSIIPLVTDNNTYQLGASFGFSSKGSGSGSVRLKAKILAHQYKDETAALIFGKINDFDWITDLYSVTADITLPSVTLTGTRRRTQENRRRMQTSIVSSREIPLDYDGNGITTLGDCTHLSVTVQSEALESTILHESGNYLGMVQTENYLANMSADKRAFWSPPMTYWIGTDVPAVQAVAHANWCADYILRANRVFHYNIQLACDPSMLQIDMDMATYLSGGSKRFVRPTLWSYFVSLRLSDCSSAGTIEIELQHDSGTDIYTATIPRDVTCDYELYSFRSLRASVGDAGGMRNETYPYNLAKNVEGTDKRLRPWNKTNLRCESIYAYRVFEYPQTFGLDVYDTIVLNNETTINFDDGDEIVAVDFTKRNVNMLSTYTKKSGWFPPQTATIYPYIGYFVNLKRKGETIGITELIEKNGYEFSIWAKVVTITDSNITIEFDTLLDMPVGM